MEIDIIKKQLEEQADELNKQIDFKYKDIIKMDDETRKEKTQIIRTRNEILEKIKMLDLFNKKKETFKEDRYVMYKDLDNISLLNLAIKTRYDAELVGGLKYIEIIKKYEEMKDEFFWRLQNKIEMENGKRSYAGYDVSSLMPEDSIYEFEDVINLIEKGYKIKNLDEYIDYLYEHEKDLYIKVIRFENSVVVGALYTKDYEIVALVSDSNFRSCGLGTKMLVAIDNEARKFNKKLKLWAIPQNCYNFLLKNDRLIDTDEESPTGQDIFEIEK